MLCHFLSAAAFVVAFAVTPVVAAAAAGAVGCCGAAAVAACAVIVSEAAATAAKSAFLYNALNILVFLLIITISVVNFYVIFVMTMKPAWAIFYRISIKNKENRNFVCSQK